MMILDLHRQGLSVTAIARRTGRDPKTIRKYIERGLELPAYGPRQVGRPNKITPYLDYVRERVAAFPELTATRLTRELRERGYTGANTAVKRFVAAIRPSDGPRPFEVRFETPPGHQAQVDFARFVTVFDDEPGITRIIWLFSMVLGHSRHIVARFGLHQDLQTLLRCLMAAFAAMGGVPIEILYDRMKTAVTGEDEQGHIVYNRSLLALAKHYGFHPRACRPYRAKTKGKVERPFSYIRKDFFLARSFRNLDDLNTQLQDWLGNVANVRLHATTQKIVSEAFAAERSTCSLCPPCPSTAAQARTPRQP
jgi:transposase